MSVLVAYSNTPEGRAALQHGHKLARIAHMPLVAFDLDNYSTAEDRSIDAPAPDLDNTVDPNTAMDPEGSTAGPVDRSPSRRPRRGR